jgi:hypothetical protein
MQKKYLKIICKNDIKILQPTFPLWKTAQKYFHKYNDNVIHAFDEN